MFISHFTPRANYGVGGDMKKFTLIFQITKKGDLVSHQKRPHSCRYRNTNLSCSEPYYSDGRMEGSGEGQKIRVADCLL